MNWIGFPPRKLPYTVKKPFLWFAMFGFVMLALSLGFILHGESSASLKQSHPIVEGLDIFFLGLCSLVFFDALFRSTIFSEDEINCYYFFLIHRQFRYDELASISLADSYWNSAVRFNFSGGKRLRVALTYVDADYLLEVLRERTTCGLTELARFRDDHTPRDVRIRWSKPEK